MFAALLVSSAAGADRNILTPRGVVALPDSVQARYLTQTADDPQSLGWLAFGSPVSDLSLELEIEQSNLVRRRGTTFGLQYMLTTEAFSDVAPALSVGVRDVLNHAEGRAGYLSLTKAMGLSRQQERVVRQWKLHAGYGTGTMGGVFVSTEARLAAGFTARLEYMAWRVNAGISLPVCKGLSLDAYSLNGDLWAGVSVSLVR